MVTSVARSRRSCDLGVHGNVVPYRAYILAVRAVVDATRWRHTSVHLSQHDRAVDRALDRQRQKGRASQSRRPDWVYWATMNDDCVDLPHWRPRHDCYPLKRVAAFSRARRRSADVGSTRSELLQSRAARLLWSSDCRPLSLQSALRTHSPRRDDEASALDISRNPGASCAPLWRLWKIFRPRDKTE